MDFPVGNQFDSDIRFDWYKLGVLYSFLGQGRMPEISPKLELAFLDFDYALDTPDGKAHRDYIKVVPRVGAEVKMPLTGMLDLKLEAATSVRFSNMPMISNVAFELGAHVMPKHSPVDARIFSRVGYQRIDYEDNQDLPNHIRLEMKPFPGVGVNIQF